MVCYERSDRVRSIANTSPHSGGLRDEPGDNLYSHAKTEAQTMQDRNYEFQELAEAFIRDYHKDDVAQLAQKYPKDQKSIEVDWRELHSFDPDFALDYLDSPDELHPYLEDAVRTLDIPIDQKLPDAHVRVGNLLETEEYYPTTFSPTTHASNYRTIVGDVLVTTDVYAKLKDAAFECQRCGTLTRIPQTGEELQEPHECQGCERQGPFQINYEQSEFVDGETIQLQTPPEVTNGTGSALQVFVEDDITGQVEMGDRIAVSGVVHLNQKGNQRQMKAEFEPYVDGHHIEIREATSADIDVDQETKQKVQDLANGEYGDPLTIAAKSLHPGVHGHLTEKKALILAIVGGATNTPDIRGKFHVLFIGDPATAKSELVGRVDDIAVRSVPISSKQSSTAGITTTATQGEFSDGRWTLSPGAFVKANEGVVPIEELDDMPPEDRSAMLEPMANQQIHVSKAGINATLSTKTAVIAGANPEQGRFDTYQPLDEQFGFESNLISRFDLVYTFVDKPDEEDDRDVADHMSLYRDGKIREANGHDVPESEKEIIDKPVDDDTLRYWLAIANQRPDPVYESHEVREKLRDSFVNLRGANGYGEDAEVPVTFRKFPAVERVARAHAKLEDSDTIKERHAEQAMAMVGKSMQDYQTDEDGKLDADIAETGKSQSQKSRRQEVIATIKDITEDEDGAKVSNVIGELSDTYSKDRLERDIDKLFEEGEAVEPQTGFIRYMGKYA